MRHLTRRHLVGILVALALTIAALALGFGVSAMEQRGGGVHVSGAWVRPTLGNNPNSAAYMTIMNHGKTDDTLVAVSGGLAKAIVLHTHVREGDVMRMRRVEGGLAIAAGKGLALQPGGHHVMLIGLTRKLAVGQTVPLTLEFSHAGKVEVEVKVQMAPGGGGAHGMQHKH